ncbi:cupin domain-containing protein [Novosphingobium resinovorum]|uniref:cupin domain-containing protein n=1 Tax=Novosphingobium TaxID=165696 RepID=UPI001B3C9581|nr:MULTISPECIES: cupin domain-containing protein [Novosphingobium]MBF7013587.1 cupin domain-containing protein [Novosphingobium sp. HR1a]WJM25737.1 cupin domain-containing protein [Novosphingobium resinovorum]
MARPHIEFIQTQNVDWRERSDGVLEKRLSHDPLSTDATLIVRLPPGFVPGPRTAGEPGFEYFVLDGAVTVDERPCARHAYGFIPQGSGLGAMSSGHGATLLVFRHALDDPNALAECAEAIAIDTARMPWDTSTYDPKLGHLRLARKVLRLGPNDSGRTFLLTGLPHGVPDETHLPTETHHHCEEAFMLQGEMWAPEGRMRQGAYFFRPPNIVHGPHVSETGFLQIMRSPGSNQVANQWSDDLKPLPIGTAYSPVVPEGMPSEWLRPLDDAPAY